MVKIPRIFGELQHSIKQKQTRFFTLLENTTFMTQLLSFPKCKHDDGPDAGGMIKDELNRRWSEPHEPRPFVDPVQKMIEKQSKATFQNLAQPWVATREKAIKAQQRRDYANRRTFI